MFSVLKLMINQRDRWTLITLHIISACLINTISISSNEFSLDLSEEIVQNVLNQAEQDMVEQFYDSYQRGAELPQDTPSWYMAMSHSMKPAAKNISEIALIMEEVTRYMSDQYNLTHYQISNDLMMMNISYTSIGKNCPIINTDQPCQPRKYRSYSGYCNNVLNPYWGTANVGYQRFLPADYDDGISIPRGGGLFEQELNSLPSPREISLNIHSNKIQEHHKHLMVLAVIWGEFISHDISHTPQTTGQKISRLKCCGVNITDFHPECLPIRLTGKDPNYASKIRESCQEYIRSATASHFDCKMGPREQMNQATSFIDGSMIYGTSVSESGQLRVFQKGFLKMFEPDSVQSLMAVMVNNTNFCRVQNDRNRGCVQAGDVRANEHIGLTVMYTLWYRQHNRIASKLAEINPHWNDEQLFQESRKIVIAMLQHITYNEFLPVVLGEVNIRNYDLKLQKVDYFDAYDLKVNPSVANSVATAVLPFLMTLLPNVLSVINHAGVKVGEQSLLGTFYAPLVLFEYGGMDRVLQGMLHGPTMNSDSYLIDGLVNSLFKTIDYGGNGLDIASHIIQQGRDHGLPSYIEYRHYCRLPEIKTFTDLTSTIPEDLVQKFQKLYKGVSDIDLFSGGLSEIPMEGALVGPTFACLLSEQFRNLRFGDRHWYENNLPPSAFTIDQLREIRKVKLTQIICENSDFIQFVQSNPFISKDNFLNNMLQCKNHMEKEMNLRHWEEEHPELTIDRNLLNSALTGAKEDLEEVINAEISTHKLADPNSPIGAAFSFNRPKREAQAIANASLFYQYASKRFIWLQMQQQDEETKGASSNQVEEIKQLISILPNININDMFSPAGLFGSGKSNEPVCSDTPGPCDHTTKYRTITGRCNNLNVPERGQALKTHLRLQPPVYNDGIAAPRQSSVTGGVLPSPRLVSQTLHLDETNPHPKYALMLMQFAQILDHELTHTPVYKGHLGLGILDCSACDSAKTVHPDCIPIPIPSNDSHFPETENGKPKCIPVTRSLPGRLSLGYREQMNQVTSYIDGSFIYGSDNCESRILRSFDSGLMKSMKVANRKELLPKILTHPECRSRNGFCFHAGDARASEQPGLTALHTIFLREHNRVAKILKELNEGWNDEKLYQETRRIMAAFIQHIAFSEFLPRIFGWDFIKKFNLDLQPTGYYTKYDPECDSMTLNEFAAAAFRFGHTLLRPMFLRMSANYKKVDPPILLRNHFFNPEIINHDGMIDEILRGLIVTPMETFDQFITKEVTNHLFEDITKPFSGMDLAALNIQRARDHGIPGYNVYRHYCNLTKANSFNDLLNTIKNPDLIQKFQGLYENVNDIDLFPGGLLENSLIGGIIGPTFACIVGNQFQRLRRCDRFWYENIDPFIRFTHAQLTEIRKITLARLLCDNMDDIEKVTRNVMDMPDIFLNPMIDCDSIPEVNFIHWKELNSCLIENDEIKIGKSKNISPCIRCTCTKEGVVCNSIKVQNCYKLMEKYSWRNVMKDTVCKIQCAFMKKFII